MIEFSVDADKMRAYFESFTPRLVLNLALHIKRFEIFLVSYIRENKLSGDPLNRRSGNLSRSMNGSDPVISADLVEGSVGTNLEYGRIHELGGTFTIKSFVREQSMAWGRPITPQMVTVREHQATYPKRAFLAPSLVETQPTFVDEMKAAVKETAEE